MQCTSCTACGCIVTSYNARAREYREVRVYLIFFFLYNKKFEKNSIFLYRVRKPAQNIILPLPSLVLVPNFATLWNEVRNCITVYIENYQLINPSVKFNFNLYARDWEDSEGVWISGFHFIPQSYRNTLQILCTYNKPPCTALLLSAWIPVYTVHIYIYWMWVWLNWKLVHEGMSAMFQVEKLTTIKFAFIFWRWLKTYLITVYFSVQLALFASCSLAK